MNTVECPGTAKGTTAPAAAVRARASGSPRRSRPPPARRGRAARRQRSCSLVFTVVVVVVIVALALGGAKKHVCLPTHDVDPRFEHGRLRRDACRRLEESRLEGPEPERADQIAAQLAVVGARVDIIRNARPASWAWRGWRTRPSRRSARRGCAAGRRSSRGRSSCRRRPPRSRALAGAHARLAAAVATAHRSAASRVANDRLDASLQGR